MLNPRKERILEIKTQVLNTFLWCLHTRLLIITLLLLLLLPGPAFFGPSPVNPPWISHRYQPPNNHWLSHTFTHSTVRVSTYLHVSLDCGRKPGCWTNRWTHCALVVINTFQTVYIERASWALYPSWRCSLSIIWIKWLEILNESPFGLKILF